MTNTVLVVEDDAMVREALGQTLELAGYVPVLAGSFIVAKDHISADFPGIVLSDIRMPGRDGLYLLGYVQSIDADLPVILLTGEGDIPMAVGSINKGAYDFLEKPCANEVLTEAIRKAMRERELVLENRALTSELTRGDAAARMIFGVSDMAEALRDQVRRLARIDDAVLIEGPPGSGIAKVAEVIHQLSARAKGEFQGVAGSGLSPASLTEHLAATDAGTLFIEEVVSMPDATQFALLDHLDAMQGARVLAGVTETQDDRPLTPELNYRLDALRIRVPALVERTEDIPVIFRHYVREIAEQARVAVPDVTPDVIAGLMAQEWPGNTRALRNAAMRLVLGLEEPLDGAAIGLVEKMAQVERALIVDALVRHAGHATATARTLKLPRKTFYDKLAKHGIKAEDYR